jgi:ribosomal protein S18 acetylase RimI-like enzyme
MNDFQVYEADLLDKDNSDILFNLINTYMADPMGGVATQLKNAKKNLLIDGLIESPSSLIFFCKKGNDVIGASVCFVAFSTFLVRPLINIHDLIILPEYRKCGAGTALMIAIEEKARALNCAKITLEVRYDNYNAKKLYKKCGFSTGDAPMEFWTNYLV